ncbi:MAG: hypothetical protein ABJA62_02720 [Luteimonas sp.]
MPSDPNAETGGLTPEERDLAQRLARLGGQREPSPALDAKILCAAHDAVQVSAAATATQRRRTRRRWPVALGAVASLAFAVGIAWRLRPLPHNAVEYSEAPMAAQESAQAIVVIPRSAHVNTADAAATASTTDGANSTERGGDAAVSAMRAPPEAMPENQDKAIAEPKREAFSQNEKTRDAAPEESPIVFDDALSVQAPTAPAAPAAPPPPTAFQSAPAASAGAAAKAAKQDNRTNESRARGEMQRASSPTTDAAAEADGSTSLDRIEVTGSRIKRSDIEAEDEPMDEQPPVSADSPQVRQAWLQRIRELVARGKLDEARASLHEYRHRYPDQPLPDDLGALVE